MSSQPDLFIVRQVFRRTPQGDTVTEAVPVRLIQVDELPDFLEIECASRYMSWEDARGMVNLGTFAPRVAARRWAFRPPQGDCEKFGSLSDSGVMQQSPEQNTSPGQGSEASNTPWDSLGCGSTLGFTAPNVASSHEVTQPSSSTSWGLCASRYNNVSPVSPLKPPIETKPGTPTHLSRHPESTTSHSSGSGTIIRCQEWCHHGICSRGTRCTREHSMPHAQDTVALKQVGLDRLPTWYTGIPKLPRPYREGKPHVGKKMCKKMPLGQKKKMLSKNMKVGQALERHTMARQQQVLEAACAKSRAEKHDNDEVTGEYGADDEGIPIKMEEDEGAYVKIEDDKELIDFS